MTHLSFLVDDMPKIAGWIGCVMRSERWSPLALSNEIETAGSLVLIPLAALEASRNINRHKQSELKRRSLLRSAGKLVSNISERTIYKGREEAVLAKDGIRFGLNLMVSIGVLKSGCDYKSQQISREQGDE